MKPTGTIRRLLVETRVFYPVLIAAVVLPALALGVYGLWAIDSQQTSAEARVRSAYRSSVEQIAISAVTRVRAREAQIPTRVVLSVDVEGADTGEAGSIGRDGGPLAPRVFLDLLAPELRTLAQESKLFRDFVLVTSGDALFVDPLSPSADDGREHVERPDGDGVPAADIDDTSGEPQSPREARRARFVDDLLPRILDELRARPTGSPQHIALSTPDGAELFYCARVHTAPDDDDSVRRVPQGTVIAWVDLREVKQRVLGPLVASLELEQDLELSVIDAAPGADPSVDASILLAVPSSQGEVNGWREMFPNWRLALAITDVDAFRQREKFRVNLYLALIAAFIPLIGIGTFVLGRAIVGEIRTARMKTDFVSRVTHELKTPLTSIRMFIETLQMGHATTEQERDRCLSVILQESERLTRLIDRVLDFSKMEAKNKVYHFQEEDIEGVVRDTIELYRRQIAGTGGVIKLFIEKNLPRLVIDKDAVREVLLNLLDNALKYSLKEKLVAIRVTRERSTIHIEVKDNGMGIARDNLDLVFDKFYRVESKETAGVDGSGLGLTLSRDIARAHVGEIAIESEIGHGSKFTFVLPIHRHDEKAAQP